MGITVRVDGQSSDNEKDEEEVVHKLNLDVTTLMAYVSAQTNGSYNWEFVEPLLTEQAVKESKNHVKKYLEEIFEGKNQYELQKVGAKLKSKSCFFSVFQVKN